MLLRKAENIICGIYCIENLINHKKYIGQTVNIYSRWSSHKRELNNGTHNNDYLQHSWNKYGEKSFSFYILEECDCELLNDKERYYIDLYNTTNACFGYNLKTGGQDYNYMSDYLRKKISDGNKKYYSEDINAREQRSTAAYKQWSNPDIKAKILGENNGMYGKTHTDAAKKKMSEAAKGRISYHRNWEPVFCCELNKSYKCAVDACLDLGIKKDYAGQILQVCRGLGGRKTVGGYHWRFVEEDNI